MEALVGGFIPVATEKYEFAYRNKTTILNKTQTF